MLRLARAFIRLAPYMSDLIFVNLKLWRRMGHTQSSASFAIDGGKSILVQAWSKRLFQKTTEAQLGDSTKNRGQWGVHL